MDINRPLLVVHSLVRPMVCNGGYNKVEEIFDTHKV